MFKVLIAIVILTVISSNDGQPEVNMGQLKIVGTYNISRNGRIFAAFMGLPFAEPPIGELRFKNPLPKKPLQGILMANKIPNECPQPGTLEFLQIYGNEDCLYLNVYTPQVLLKMRKILLPTMVYLHGGTNIYGSGDIEVCSPKNLLDKDVILVTMNFRLGILGFLSTGDAEALGNFSLKDQILALQWIQKNIKFFGGNPQKVTLFGLSSGADSVNYHALSDSAEGLFHQIILQGGSAFSPRSFKPRKQYLKDGKRAAQLFGCPTNNSRLMVDCLRKIDALNITNTKYVFSEIESSTFTSWRCTDEPNIDGAYLTDNPYNLLKKKKMKDYPIMAGIVRNEGLIWIAKMYTKPNEYARVVENLDNFLIRFVTTFLKRNNVEKLVADVKQFYFNNEVSKDKNVVLSQLDNFLGDILRIYPLTMIINRHAKNAKQPLYFYTFNYRGLNSFTVELTDTPLNLGVSHVDDVYYIMPAVPFIDLEYNASVLEKDSKMSDMMVDFWTSFATNGVPVSKQLTDPYIWKPYWPEKNILKIGNGSEPTVELFNSLYEDRMQFWKQRFRRLN